MSKKKQELSTDLKERIIILNARGFNNNKVSELLGIHRSTVGRILKKFFQKGSVENDPRKRRPGMTDVRGDQKFYHIKQQIVSNFYKI